MSTPLLDPSRPGDAADLRPPSPDWERPPDRAPLLRWRAAGTALLLVLVAAAAWWAVRWLTSPVPPSVAQPSPAAPATAVPTPSAGPGDPAVPAAMTPPGAPGPSAGAQPADDHPSEPTGGPGADTGPAVLRVHVVGQVRRPGVVELPPGARVSDAVTAAGGASRDARTDRINLAAPVADGQQVLVPDAHTDLASDTAGPGSAPGSTGSPGAGGAAPTPGDDRVDLNTAEAAALETLPGVGPATAEKIIAHRESVGPYTGLQDLDAVPGIGPATLDRLADHVTW